MENKETFSYTYSAKQQEEIKKIREKYAPKEADKMEQLRRLDESVTRKGTVRKRHLYPRPPVSVQGIPEGGGRL